MSLQNSNTWVIITLLFSSVLGPVLVWNYSKADIETEKLEQTKTSNELKAKLEEKKIKLQESSNLVDLHEKLVNLYDDRRAIYDKYSSATNSFERYRVLRQFNEKNQEVFAVKKIIAQLSGDDEKNIIDVIPPFQPSDLNIKIKQF